MDKIMGKFTGYRIQVAALLFLVFSVTCHLQSTTSLAHFVKSNEGIGAVLHVDPGDDPVAGEQSNIILEFKDINNRFTLTNCDCRISVTKDSEEILNQKLPPIASDQELSSVTPVIFPEKNIYKLKVTGNSRGGAYSDFELNWDIRVEQESDSAGATSREESNWFMDHIIHLVGGGLVVLMLIAALVFNKKKVAVIILVLLILGHSLPVKAIHASHGGPVDSQAHVCCLPVAAIEVKPVEIEPPVETFSDFRELAIVNESRISDSLSIRSPPAL